MTKLLFELFGLCLVAGGFLALPFWQAKWSYLSAYCLSFILLMTFSLGLYFSISNFQGLQYWLNGGQAHYLLSEKFKTLGGIEGAIQLIKTRLEQHPDDEEGQRLLKKLQRH
jgi:hypothetical protein